MFKLTPALPSSSQQHASGFVTLPASYLTDNPDFTLTIPLTLRLLAPHPYTNQPIIAIARGPLIYCAEDVDNTWVTDHFKSVCLRTDVALEEHSRSDVLSDEEIIGIRVKDGARRLRFDKTLQYAPSGDASEAAQVDGDWSETVEFIPYYARANRGGREMMRVGFRIL